MLRFESAPLVGWNIVALSIWLAVAVDAFRKSRSGRQVGSGQFLSLFVGMTIDGVLLPVGPAVWLLWRLVTRTRRADHEVPALRGASTQPRARS